MAEKNLAKYRDEYVRAARNALAYCKKNHVAEPTWLRGALKQLGRNLKRGMRKTGRPIELLRDDDIYQRVKNYIAAGLTQPEAFERTAKDYADELKPNKNRRDRELEPTATVKAIWLRHKKRIVKDDDEAASEVGHDWRIKDKLAREFFGQKRNAELAKEMGYGVPVPDYLRRKSTKNKHC